nr:hypothetical protein [Candidatus Hydrogenedentota bacterium]
KGELCSYVRLWYLLKHALTDPTILVCRSKPDQANARDHVDDTSYFYLGYAVSNEKEVAGFCKAYREHIAKGFPFDEDLATPAEDGINATNKLYRLREGIERFYVVDINDPSAASKAQRTLPVLIERPENHEPVGGNVLFLDGHVEFIPYPGKWPMTERTITALRELDAMGN